MHLSDEPYPSTCAYTRARNIIMCVPFSSCSVVFKKYLWCPVVNQRVTNKFQKSVRKIRWYVWQSGWNRLPLHPQSREMRHWNSVWLTWWNKRRRVFLDSVCTQYLTLAGLRERERIRRGEDGRPAFYGSFEKKLFQKKLSKTFGGYDKISYLCIRFRKRWQNINESSLKDLR